MTTGTMTERLAERSAELTYADLPTVVLEKAKALLVHGIGMALAGYDTEYAAMARAVAAADGRQQEGGAMVLVDGIHRSVQGAIVANAAMMHARTQEDALGPIHLGPVVLPLCLALAEANGATGPHILEAIVTAYETAAVVSDGHTELATTIGFRPTPLFGAIAAAAAAARLLDLPVDQHAAALGYAATFSAGTLEPARAKTMEWRFQPGHAAVSGLMAARFAGSGATAAPEALEGEYGFYRTFLRHDVGVVAMDDFGRRFRILDVLTKPCPGCVYAIAPAIATVELVTRHDLAAEEIATVEAELAEYDLNYPGMDSRGPFTHPQQASGSVYFALALAQAERAVRLSGMERINDPEVTGLMDNVRLRSGAARRGMTAQVTVTTTGGATYTTEVDAQERYANVDVAGVRRLSRDLYDEMPLPEGQLDELFDLLERIETLDSIEMALAAMARRQEVVS